MKDRRHVLGYLPDEDVPRLYRFADVFVIAGIAELQSIVTMEAMASGLPIIAADAMALPELVVVSRREWILVSSGRRASLGCSGRYNTFRRALAEADGKKESGNYQGSRHKQGCRTI